MSSTKAEIAIETRDQISIPIRDHNGSVATLLRGWSAQDYRYSAFGEILLSPSSAPCPYQYLAKRTDGETGFVYFGARYYLPELGRWLTPDPLLYVDGPNRYGYCLANPYRYSDPWGLSVSENIGRFFAGMWDTGRASFESVRSFFRSDSESQATVELDDLDSSDASSAPAEIWETPCILDLVLYEEAREELLLHSPWIREAHQAFSGDDPAQKAY